MANLTTNILTLNTNVVTTPVKLEEIRRLLESERADIALLQEVAVPSFNFYGFDEMVNVGPNNRGTALLWRSSLPIKDLTVIASGRGVAGTFGDVRVVNIYAPSGTANQQERNKFFAEDITPLFAGAAVTTGRVVLGGDFNCVLSAEDTTGAFRKSPTLHQLVNRLSLCDAWEARPPRNAQFTYHTAVCRSRLDRVYISATTKQDIKSVHVHTVSFGNHQAVSVHVNLGVPYAPQGPSYWKAARHLFHDSRFKPLFATKWNEWQHHRRRFADVADWWDKYAKPRVQSFCRQFEKTCREERKSMMNHYLRCLGEVYAKQTLTAEDIKTADELRQAIKAHQREQAQETAQFAKTTSPCGGEEPSMHSIYTIKEKKGALHIGNLEDADGNHLQSQREIIDHVHEVYTEKFAAPSTPLPDSSPVLDSVQNSLNDADRAALAAPITMEEATAAVGRAPRNKSPGSDGLPAEFYSITWDIVGETILDVLNTALRRGRLCDSMYVGVMVLIPKVKYPTTIKHYRPVTLLNADYKLLARCIAARLSVAVAKVAHPMVVQAGAARNITGALCDLRDVVAYHDLLGQPGCLVSADIVGAFDNVRHDYLFELLRRMGFGDTFVSIMRTMYAAGCTRVQVNGFLSMIIKVLRSVRQGCPMSSLVFTLVINPLVSLLHDKLTGIDAREAHFSVTAYADDVTVLVRDDKDVETMQVTLEQYGEVSGLAVSEAKTVAIPLGTWDQGQHPLPYKYVDSCRILGIIFARTISEMANLTWTKVVTAVNFVLLQNRQRPLNLVQRVWFVSTYGLSKLWYVAQVLPVPDQVAAKIYTAAASFIWAGQLYRVPFPTVCAPRAEGGLGLLHPKWKALSLFMGRWMATVLLDTDSFSSAMLQVLVEKWPPNNAHLLKNIPDSLSHYKAYHRCRPTVPLRLDLDDMFTTRDVHRGLYKQLTAANPAAEPRVHSLATRTTSWAAVWRHISRPWHGSATRSAWFKAVHDLVPTNDKLHRHNMAPSAACARCGRQDTLLHRLVDCGPVKDIRHWVHLNASRLSPDALIRPDREWKPAAWNNVLQWLQGKTVRFVLEAEEGDLTVQNYLQYVAKARASVSEQQKLKWFGDFLERLKLPAQL